MARTVEAMQTLLLGAKVLSGAALLSLAAALIDLWRRTEVPSFSYGAMLLSQKRLKALWVAFLVGALAVGSNNDPVLVMTDDTEDPALSRASEGPTFRSSLSLPFPFYRYEREREVVNGAVAAEHVREGVVLPWSFMWSLLAYYVLVVRWNPESRWARRVLQGHDVAGDTRADRRSAKGEGLDGV